MHIYTLSGVRLSGTRKTSESHGSYSRLRASSHPVPYEPMWSDSQEIKWCLIVDLSSSNNTSVNDGIDKEMCRVSFITIDNILDCILQYSKGTLMAKAEIQQAYRIIPVHPEDRCLLPM